MADHLGVPGAPQSTEVDKNTTDDTSTIRHAQPRVRKHNVKFFVNGEESQVPSDSEDITDTRTGLDEWTRKKNAAAILAHNKANRHADRVRKHNSAPNSRRTSIDDLYTLAGSGTPPIPQKSQPVLGPGVAPSSWNEKHLDEKHSTETDDSDDDDNDFTKFKKQTHDKQAGTEFQITENQSSNAPQSTRSLNIFDAAIRLENGTGARSGLATPLEDQMSEYYVPRPEQYKPSYLRQLLNAHNISVNLGALQNPVPIGSQQGSQYERVDTALPAGGHQGLQSAQDDYLFSKLKAYERPETDPRKNQPDFFQNRYRMPISPGSHSGTLTPSDATVVGSSGRLTPKRPKWYKESEQWHYNPQADEFRKSSQMSSVGKLLESTFSTASAPATPTTTKQSRPTASRKSSANSVIDIVKHPMSSVLKMNSSHSLRKEAEKRREELLRLANDRVVCQDYIVRVCRALMAFGAPTHRLEESLTMASRKLGIAASFQYFPGVMICSFSDPVMHISEVRLVKEPTAVNLGKLQDIQEIYKNVIHSQTSAAEAIEQIVFVTEQKLRYPPYMVVLFYGIAAISVGPWAFSARPVDFGIAFILGCTLGIIQVFCAARSPSFSIISEVFGTFAISFLARAFGSIPSPSGGSLFCMPALQNSAIALILPGWIILSAALELQSRNIIAGSIRMVYATFYTLILAFGTVFGLLLFGFLYDGATNDLQCTVPDYWRLTKKTDIKFLYINLPFVLAFTLCLAIVNQAKPKQLPWMVGISWIGYCANYFASIKFIYTPIANMISAFAIGLASHLYSRLFHGVAASTMLPAIFVLVPSGLAASGGLSAGLTVANDQRFNTTTSAASASVYSGTIFDVASSMIQLAIGLSVGLFVSALFMYPFGKKRSGIFSF